MSKLVKRSDVEQSIEELWEVCDDEWWFRASCDQWWGVTVRCPHGKWEGFSRGPVDLGTAFVSVVDQARAAHQHPVVETDLPVKG